MTKDDIQLLYEYDRWANNRVLQAVAALSTEQFTRDLGGSFRSVRDGDLGNENGQVAQQVSFALIAEDEVLSTKSYLV